MNFYKQIRPVAKLPSRARCYAEDFCFLKLVRKREPPKTINTSPQNQHEKSPNKRWATPGHRNIAIGIRRVEPNFHRIINLKHIPLLFGYNAAGADFTAGGRHKPIVQIVITASIGCRLKMLFRDVTNGPPAIILDTFIF